MVDALVGHGTLEGLLDRFVFDTLTPVDREETLMLFTYGSNRRSESHALLAKLEEAGIPFVVTPTLIQALGFAISCGKSSAVHLTDDYWKRSLQAEDFIRLMNALSSVETSGRFARNRFSVMVTANVGYVQGDAAAHIEPLAMYALSFGSVSRWTTHPCDDALRESWDEYYFSVQVDRKTSLELMVARGQLYATLKSRSLYTIRKRLPKLIGVIETIPAYVKERDANEGIRRRLGASVVAN